MPSQRRMRAFLYIALAGFITLLFFTSRARHAQEPDARSIQDFYHKTKSAMEGTRIGGGSRRGQAVVGTEKIEIDEDDAIVAKAMQERLRKAEQMAKNNANAKAPNKPDAPEDIVGVGSSAHGQNHLDKGESSETEEHHAVLEELRSILKKSPIIIFSKSYCPFSKKAKNLLLNDYQIDPAPYVVELDQHALGPGIQAELGERTGRKTVPNILVGGISIGGSDDIAKLDQEETLIEKIMSLAGKRLTVTKHSKSA
ncbi:thioredoxin-like protein [Neurospora tetraspora]|uniref:Thioredoxin-like protein n=1 Tax=Neurospora tetraspora TaxID=94610 RepID=A0AAE0JQ89_9PEZI|nr:thioredoxin-like protein [Neurospora tetraspora]